jgi:hypothetical protein
MKLTVSLKAACACCSYPEGNVDIDLSQEDDKHIRIEMFGHDHCVVAIVGREELFRAVHAFK